MSMNKVYNITASIFLLIILVLEVLYGYRIVDITIYSYFIVFFGLLSIIFYIISKFKNKDIKFYEVLIVLMSIFSFLSYLFAKDRFVALHGFSYGREGLLALLAYNSFILFGTLIEKKHVKKLGIIFLIIVFLNIIVSLFQSFKLPFLPNVHDYPAGFLYSASFYSTLTLLSVMLLLGRFFDNDNFKSLFILLIFVFGMFLSNVLSSLVAFIFIWFIYFISFIISTKNKKKFFIKNLYLFIGVIIVFILSNIINKNVLFADVKDTLKQTNNVVIGKEEKSLGNGRLYIWKEGFYYFNKYNYYTYGIGIDNFVYIAQDHYLRNWDGKLIVYKAHNEFLQILFCEGIYRFLIYIVFVSYINYICIKKLKNKRFKNKPYLITLIFIVDGYIIQSIFNISTLLVAPIYYFSIGLLLKGVEDNG